MQTIDNINWITLREASEKYEISESQLRVLRRNKLADGLILHQKLHLNDEQLEKHYSDKSILYRKSDTSEIQEFVDNILLEKSNYISKLEIEIQELKKQVEKKDEQIQRNIELAHRQVTNEQSLRLAHIQQAEIQERELKDQVLQLQAPVEPKKN